MQPAPVVPTSQYNPNTSSPSRDLAKGFAIFFAFVAVAAAATLVLKEQKVIKLDQIPLPTDTILQGVAGGGAVIAVILMAIRALKTSPKSSDSEVLDPEQTADLDKRRSDFIFNSHPSSKIYKS